jgi:rod shape-determining protein MreC
MRNKKLLIAGVAVIILILLNLPISISFRFKCNSRDSVAPFQRFARYVGNKSRDLFRPLSEARRAIEEKQRMLEENANLVFQLQNLKVLEKENEELRRQLSFKQQQRRTLVMCEVISRGGASGWWQTVRLGKGRRHGLGPDQAVITADGLVGRTGGVGQENGSALVVGDFSCDVLLLTDPNCKVACKFPRTGALGILRGRGVSLKGDAQLEVLCAAQPCRLDYISRNYDILPGDEVRTSGLGGVFPEGLLVGHVGKVEMDQSGLYQRAEVVPGARLEEIKYAFVVVPEDGRVGRLATNPLGGQDRPPANSGQEAGE